MRPDGTILDRPGYDEASGLLLDAPSAVLAVPEHPTGAEVCDAVDALLEVVADFPFALPAYRSAWVAALLTMVARHAIAGNVPAILVDANARGSGKGLAVDTIAMIAMGDPMPRSPQPKEDEEMRKSVTAAAVADTPAILIDNVTSVMIREYLFTAGYGRYQLCL